MTGSTVVKATSESRADSAINLRTSSWSYPVDLNLKYPINDRFYVTSTTGYLHRSYAETTILSDLTEYSRGQWTFTGSTPGKLDLFAGYRSAAFENNCGPHHRP